MKRKVKKWIDRHPGEVALLVCLAIGIPIGLWLGSMFYRHIDEPWAVSHRALCPHQVAVFALVLTLWLILCHTILCVRNRKNPVTYLLHSFKTSKD